MTRGRNNAKRTGLAKPPSPDRDVLGPEECAVWIAVCKGQTAEWLETGPGPLLETYCFATVLQRKLRTQLRVWQSDPDNKGTDIPEATMERMDAVSKLLERLSRRLRLDPASRVRTEKAGNRQANTWDLDDEDESA